MPLPYVLPQVKVFQEFTEVSPEITNPLRAWVIGPNANLFRYSDEDEKSLIALAQYNYQANPYHAYSWPHKTPGSVIDKSYVKLFIDKAKLLYFSDLVGFDTTIASVNGFANRVRSSGLCFQTTDDVNVRSDAFLDRDVQPGDIVRIHGSSAGSQDTLWTYVKDFAREVTPAVIANPVADAANKATVGGSVTINQTAGAHNQVELIVDVTDYNAYIDGFIDDTYTITVVTGSVDGDYRTAVLRITTASGREFLTGVVPASNGSTTLVGNRGLRIGFDDDGSSVGISEGIDHDDLVAGQTWTARIIQAFTRPTMGHTGTYTGDKDNTYVVTVVSGGFFDDANINKRPRVTIRTVDGSESIVNKIVDVDVAFALGIHGANMQFNTGTGLVKGDRYLVAVTARTVGRTSTLILGHSLSNILQAATDLDLYLYIQDNIQVPAYVTEPVPGFNWVATDTEFQMYGGITAFHDSWTDGGVAQPLPVVAGALYLEYREWLPDFVNEIEGIADISEIDNIPGALHPDNPLKWAVSKAVANCGGTAVRYTAISDPLELDAWVHALSLGTERSDLYSLVPLTYDREVLNLFVSHVNTMSSETTNKWRKVFINLQVNAATPIVTAALSTDEEPVKATITDDPNTTGTQYTLVQITSANVSLIELGVQAGDLLRTNFATDAVGNVTYDEFIIEELVSEDVLLLTSGPDSPISTAQLIEIHHTNSKTELATQIGLNAGVYGNRRVCAVWPDTVGSAGVTYPGYHLCAALAGLAGGVVPQQHLTNVEVAGFDDFTRVTKLFDRTQLDLMASYGVWIVTQNTDGNVITRDALTTDRTSLQSETEMVVRNVDSISFVMYNSMVKYIGRSNVVQTTLDLIRVDLVGAIEFLKTNGFVARLGGQLIDADIIQLRQSVIQKDHVICAINLQIPYPLNVLELHLIA